MKKLLWKQMRQRLSICMLGVLLALGIATGLGGVTPVQAVEEIAISSAEELMNMESNPSGSYYLTKDITLPQNMSTLFSTYELQFTGTLDGRGHKLKNYTFQSSNPAGDFQVQTSLFGYAENATFKNFSITNVNINIDAGQGGASVHPLVLIGDNCKFDKIKISGKITVKSVGKDEDYNGSNLEVSGLIKSGVNCKVTNCSSSLKIKVSGGYSQILSVGGLAEVLTGEKGTVKNCSFSGDISASAKIAGSAVDGYNAAGICALFSQTKISGCSNSGNITIKIQKGGTASPFVTGCIGAYGIGGGELAGMSSCKNTGKIKAAAASGIQVQNNTVAAGLAQSVCGNTSKVTLTRCWNKGSVSATGKLANAGGICIKAYLINQCYNKGTVSASGFKLKANQQLTEFSEIGGVCVSALRVQNCYNVGKVALKGTGYAGGLASLINVDYGVSTSNYATGAVSVKNGGLHSYPAALCPRSDGVEGIMKPKCYIYNNYYTASTGCTAYSLLSKNGGKTAPKAAKVSSITSKSCPKLSSKYWTYSSKYKRLVLKNNKEK